MQLRDLPNAISAARLLSAAPIGVLLYLELYGWAFLALLLAGLSDALDGWLVRRFGWHSRLGAWLDPAADKALMLAIYVAVALNGLIPMWLLFLVIGRDVWLTSMTFVYQRFVGDLAVKPLLISKVNTALQIALVLLAVLKVGVLAIETTWVALLSVVVAATTIASGVAYTVVWGRRGLGVLAGRRRVASGAPTGSSTDASLNRLDTLPPSDRRS
ncbi:MAG: CDP-alcohol phosphatidyltransferase family protein [Thioalkalivibrionaceae bacterium]